MAPYGHRVELARAEDDVRLGREYILRQEQLIAKLRRDKCDTRLAEVMLGTLRVSQVMNEKHRSLLLREIAANAKDAELMDNARTAIALSRQLLGDDRNHKNGMH